MKLLKITFWISLAATLALIAGSIVLSEFALHPPRKLDAHTETERANTVARQCQASEQSVSIHAPGGVTLHAWWLRPANPSGKVVIVLHGIADSAVSSLGFAPLLLSHGYSMLAPDSRGHGQSGGFATYGVLESRDIVLWTQWIRHTAPHSSIFGLGESLGGAIVLQSLRAGAPLSAVVAEGAYSSFGRIARERIRRQSGLPVVPSLIVFTGIEYVKWRYGIDLSQADTLAAVAGAHVPILLIHGADDHRTDPANSLALEEANPKWVRIWLVPWAGHTGAYQTDPAQFERRVLDWLK